MKKIIFSTLCISALITACSSEEYIAEEGNAQKLMLATTIDAPVTRAGTTVQSTQFANGQKLGIWTFTGTGSSAVYQNKNIPMTADGSGHLTTDGDGIFYDPATSVNVWAMHPYMEAKTAEWKTTEENECGGFFSVTEIQTTDDGYRASDLCSGFLNNIKADNNSHVIPMKHLMSKITINVQPGDAEANYDGVYNDIQGIYIRTQKTAKVTLNKLQTTGTSGPIVSVTAQPGEEKKNYPMASSNTVSSSFIVPPGQVYEADEQLFLIPFSNRQPFTYHLQNALNLESGKEYIFKLRVKLKKIDVSLEVCDWVSEDKNVIINY